MKARAPNAGIRFLGGGAAGRGGGGRRRRTGSGVVGGRVSSGIQKIASEQRPSRRQEVSCVFCSLLCSDALTCKRRRDGGDEGTGTGGGRLHLTGLGLSHPKTPLVGKSGGPLFRGHAASKNRFRRNAKNPTDPGVLLGLHFN